VRHDLLLDPLLVALPEGHALARARSVDLSTLSREPWIIGASHGPCEEASRAALSAAGFTPWWPTR